MGKVSKLIFIFLIILNVGCQSETNFLNSASDLEGISNFNKIQNEISQGSAVGSCYDVAVGNEFTEYRCHQANGDENCQGEFISGNTCFDLINASILVGKCAYLDGSSVYYGLDASSSVLAPRIDVLSKDCRYQGLWVDAGDLIN